MRSNRFLNLVLALVLATAGFAARAQGSTEPTVQDIYQAANHGNVTGARTMVDQVVARHPNSAKAHYVKAEIAVRQQDVALARSELATAQRLAPGLPFAKAEAVNALRSELDGMAQRVAPARTTSPDPSTARRLGDTGAGRSFPTGGLVALLLFLGAGILFLRSRMRALPAPAQAYRQPQEPERFGRYEPNVLPPGYGYGGMPPGAYPAAQPESMGSSIGRGLATGLAVGAGAVVAQEIGHRIFEHNSSTHGVIDVPAGHAGAAADSSLARDAGLGAISRDSQANADMGGEDFGIADNGGWDSAAGGDFGVADGGGGSDDWNN